MPSNPTKPINIFKAVGINTLIFNLCKQRELKHEQELFDLIFFSFFLVSSRFLIIFF